MVTFTDTISLEGSSGTSFVTLMKQEISNNAMIPVVAVTPGCLVILERWHFVDEDVPVCTNIPVT